MGPKKLTQAKHDQAKKSCCNPDGKPHSSRPSGIQAIGESLLIKLRLVRPNFSWDENQLLCVTFRCDLMQEYDQLPKGKALT